MQVEAIYVNGAFTPVTPIRLRHDRVRVVVEVPDEEVELQSTPAPLSAALAAKAQEMLDKFQGILDAPLAAGDVEPESSREYGERMNAIELRAQLRQEQGRPV